MAEEYDIDMDPVMDGDGFGGKNLPRVLDPVMTVQVVQKFMEVERRRNRRAFLWLSSVFLLVILLILSLFAGIGVHVLRNSSDAANAAKSLQAQTAVYASEVLGLSDKVNRMSEGTVEIEGLIRMKEDQRLKDGRILRSDLERFGRWVESRTSQDKQTIETLLERLNELETKVATAPPAASSAGEVSAGADKPAAIPVSEDAAVAAVEVEPVVQAEGGSLPVTQVTAPEAASEDIDGKFDVAMLEPVRVAVPVPPLERGDVSVVTFPNGDRYKGPFKAGLFHGWGEYAFKNGDSYEGYFSDDLKAGKGTYVYANGDKYVGEFQNDMRQGTGSLLYANGDKYVGEFKGDTITGKGAKFYSNGNKYSGDFKDGIKQGNGLLSYFNGDSYKGEFKDDLRNGRGVYVFSDGSKYVGEFKDDKRHGTGRFIFADGGEYVGLFKDGMKHGEGVCVYPDGRRLKGIWKDDKFVKTLD
jgi:hypothetical protein